MEEKENCEMQDKDQKIRWYQHVTVEPTLFLYMMAFMVTAVCENVYFNYKSCTVNHGYPHEICIDLANHSAVKKEVQKTTSNFLQYNNIAGHIIPIVLALFIGSFSDRRGRKLPLIMGLVGKFIYSGNNFQLTGCRYSKYI